MGAEGVERKLTTILSADVAGYSRLMGEDEEATLLTLNVYRQVIDRLIAGHRGRVFASAGDSVVAEFRSAVEAVRCAVEIQQELEKRNAELPEDRRMRFRIGFNLGDVMVDGDNLLGDGVNVAARLQELAEPGGISISGTVFDQVKSKLDLGYENLGEQEVKNIAEPVRVYRVLLEPEAAGKVIGEAKPAGPPWRWVAVAATVIVVIGMTAVVTWLRPWAPDVEPASLEKMAFPLPEKPSIAVLPFANLSGDPEQGYFADGMTDDLITDLSKISGLFVIARNSVFAYKGRVVKVRQVAEELGVRYVLEGSVRRAGDQVRVNAQLIDATTGGHVWADRYDGSIVDIFTVQDKFVRNIVEALALNLSEGEQEEIPRGQTSNIDAREAFQKGWEYYLRFTPGDNAKAAEHLKRAVELDPEYGRAYSALGLVYVRGLQWRWTEELGMGIRQANSIAQRYLSEGERHTSSLTKVAASQIHLYNKRYEKAFTEAARAIALDPNDPEANVAMGLAMITTGRPEAGLEFVETARRLNPSHPSHYVLAHGMAYFSMDDLEQAAAVLGEALERDPGAVELAPLLAATYAHLGRREEARASLLLWKPGASQIELQNLAFFYHSPYVWASDNREIESRLFDGLHIANLPAEVTVSTLIDALKKGKEVDRRRVAKTLGRFGPAAEAAVPALIEALQDESRWVRGEVALTLGKIGPAAKAAVPALTEAWKDESVRVLAKEALERIARH